MISGEVLFSDWNFGYRLSKNENPMTESQNTDEPMPKTNNTKNIKEISFTSETAKAIFEAIGNGKNTIDMIIAELALPFETVTLELTMLELDGHIAVNEFGIYNYI